MENAGLLEKKYFKHGGSQNATLNRNVFSCFLKELRESVARMASGRLFQRRGAALGNAFFSLRTQSASWNLQQDKRTIEYTDTQT